MDIDRTTFAPDTVMASFSEQSRTTFRHAAGRLSVILTPPEEFLRLTREEVLARACAAADRLGLRLSGRVKAYRVINHPEDFHTFAPGHEHLRPQQRTPIRGITLAGDYTRQKYLATMEGAVVSGRIAAEAVLEDSGAP
jgi:15-cis-phytoene desaturase